MFTPWARWALVILTVAILTAIALPNFVKARTNVNRPSCVANLKQIDGAIQQWALENKKEDKDAPDLNAAACYLKGGVLPICPKGGTYRAGATVMAPPTCSKANTLGHSLP